MTSEAADIKPSKLEDLMVAMDVVDTLRHDQLVVERELDIDGRRDRLLQRLRDIYSAQGIEVADHVLIDGIKALEEERFKYQPVPRSWRTKLAHVWVSRKRWSKPLGFLSVLGGLFSGVYVATDVLPERQLAQRLPQQLEQTVTGIINVSKVAELTSNAIAEKQTAIEFVESGELDAAQAVLQELTTLREELNRTYSIRVVARPNQASGVWRVPPNNSFGRNYYLIVEAVDSSMNVVPRTVLNEEDNSLASVTQWGLRVPESVFNAVASDKRDDGIIQKNVVGEKLAGYLEPEYQIQTTGGAITRW